MSKLGAGIFSYRTPPLPFVIWLQLLLREHYISTYKLDFEVGSIRPTGSPLRGARHRRCAPGLSVSGRVKRASLGLRPIYVRVGPTAQMYSYKKRAGPQSKTRPLYIVLYVHIYVRIGVQLESTGGWCKWDPPELRPINYKLKL